MSTTVIDLKDAAKYFGHEWPTKFRSAAIRGLLSAAMRGVQVIQTSIIPSRNPSPEDRGTYKAGWHFGPIVNGAELWDDSPAAAFIEDGVRAANVKPGRAMLTALAEWALRKGLVSDPKEAKSAAFAIARNMQKRGIFNRGSTGLGILREFVEKYAETYSKEEIEREIARELG